MSLRIALLQIKPFGSDQDANLAKGLDFCRKAKAHNADIVLFPEMWNIGYKPYSQRVFGSAYDPNDPNEQESIAKWQQQAISRDSDFVPQYQKLARELNMAIAITYLEKHDPKPRNVISLIDRYGEIVLHYAKMHLCSFSMEGACDAGNEVAVCDLDTVKGKVKVGAMICFDREFPETARLLMLKGAELILVPNACDLDVNRYNQIHARAFENMLSIAVCNYPQPENNGNSVVVSGIAYNQNGLANNMLLTKNSKCEKIVMADLDLDALRDYRMREVWGAKLRRPECYAGLIR